MLQGPVPALLINFTAPTPTAISREALNSLNIAINRISPLWEFFIYRRHIHQDQSSKRFPLMTGLGCIGPGGAGELDCHHWALWVERTSFSGEGRGVAAAR